MGKPFKPVAAVYHPDDHSSNGICLIRLRWHQPLADDRLLGRRLCRIRRQNPSLLQAQANRQISLGSHKLGEGRPAAPCV